MELKTNWKSATHDDVVLKFIICLGSAYCIREGAEKPVQNILSYSLEGF